METLAIVRPGFPEAPAPVQAPVLEAALGLTVLSLLLGRLTERIQREISRIVRALSLPPPPLPGVDPGATRPPADSTLAVLLVSGYDREGIEGLLAVRRMAPGAFRQAIFLAVRPFDGTDEERRADARALEAAVERELRLYLGLSDLMDLAGETRVLVGPDPEELGLQAGREIVKAHPRVVFFLPYLAPLRRRWYHRWLEDPVRRSILDRLRQEGCVTHEIPVPVAVRGRAAGA